MMRLKRAVSLVLTLIMLIPAANVFAVSSDDNIDIYKLMTGLGLYTDKYRMDEETEEMDRKTAAAVLAHFYGVDDSEVGTSYPTGFSDVEAENAYAPSINAVCINGAMKGYEDLKFRPDDALSMQEAVRAFIVILGWKQYVDYQGGGEFADTWMKKAAELGLTKGISKSKDDPVTKGEFTSMLYRAFDAEYLMLYEAGDVFKFKSNKKGLLPEKMDIYVEEGVVSAIGSAALYGADDVDDGCVKIGDKIMEASNDAKNYLGYRVKYYYSKSGDEEKLLYLAPYKTNAIVINAQNIDDATFTSILYTNENNRSRTVKISNPASVIENGRRNSYYSKESFMPSNGTVTIIDADENGVYETVIIKSYYDMVVRTTYLDDNILYIYEKRDFPNRRSLKIDLDGNARISFYKNGSPASYTDIAEDNVISVVTDEKENRAATAYDIYICGKTATETIKTYSATDKTAVVGDIEYEFEADYNFNEMPVNLGEVSILRFNAFGKIVEIEKSSSNMKYGFLTKAWESEDDEMLYLKIFTADGEMKTFKVGNTLWIDGKIVKDNGKIIQELTNSSEEFHNKIRGYSGEDFIFNNSVGTEQFVKFAANKDIIKKIDTVVDGTESDGLTFDYYSKQGSNRNWISHYSGRSTLGEDKSSDGFRISTDENIHRFRVPNSLSLEKGFTSEKLIDSTNRYWDNVGVFDMDKDVNLPKVLVEFSASSLSPTVDDMEYNKAIVIEKITEGLNSDDEAVTIIQGMTVNGTITKRKLYLADDCATHGDFEISELKSGDFITYCTNALGEISTIRKAAAVDGSGSLLYTGHNATDSNKDNQCILAKVNLVRGNFWKYKYSSSISDTGVITYTEDVGNWSFVNDKIYKINRRSKIINKVSIDALKTIEDVGEDEANDVFICFYKTRPYMILIYD